MTQSGNLVKTSVKACGDKIGDKIGDLPLRAKRWFASLHFILIVTYFSRQSIKR